MSIAKIGDAKLKITQLRSGIGGTARQRETLKTLGLRRIGATVVREGRPEVRGMVRSIEHLVDVEEVSE
ncbi:MAG: large subunit ribosomal protein [Frankiaceae bacterium]|jgi:large subunit ribosomal protein L30|nr:large subunit ribosomal protein [Frankiaceae bacterium]